VRVCSKAFHWAVISARIPSDYGNSLSNAAATQSNFIAEDQLLAITCDSFERTLLTLKILDPELESWIWQDSPQVAVVGFTGGLLRDALRNEGQWRDRPMYRGFRLDAVL